MKKYLIIILTAMMALMSAQAQIPADVAEIMKKSDAAMSSTNGVEITMDMKTSLAFVTLTNINIVMGSKDDRFKALMSFSLLGTDIKMESGFDGTQEWVATKDTVYITQTTSPDNNDNGADLGIYKNYKKAKMKVKSDYYDIDFSDPIDKKNEVKSVNVKVSKSNYQIKEMKMSAKGAKITITVKKVKKGLNDSYFKLDLNKYPEAVVVRN
jgi:hypothetical protein